MASYVFSNSTGAIVGTLIFSNTLDAAKVVPANTPAGCTATEVPDGSPALAKPLAHKIVAGKVAVV
ncbi:MAG: hypothetical protein ACRD18_07530 [Terriglobia bacterium]